MRNDYYPGTYIPGIAKWGKITLLLGIFAGFLPALVMASRGYMPPVSATIVGTLMQISVSGTFYIVEPISYLPILSIPGIHLIFFLDNTSNMYVPRSSVTQEAAGVEMGTEEGSVISTIGIAMPVLVNVVILTMGAATGSVILDVLLAPVEEALNFLLPALLGAVLGQFAATCSKPGVMAAIIATGMNQLMKLGSLSFIPGNSSYVAILAVVLGSICAGKLLYKEELQVD